MKKIFFLPVIFITFSSGVYSQIALQKDKEISINLGIGSTMIENYNINHDKNLTVDDKNGPDFSVEFSKYFLDNIGIGIGLGYSSFDQTYYQKGLFKQTNQVDNEGKIYDKWINSDVKYSNKLNYSNIPVTLHFLLGSSSRCYAFLDAGIINQFLINGTYTKNGTIETIAKYPSESGNPDWFGITMNNSYYNATNTSISEKDTKKYKLYNLSGHFALGVSAAMAKGVYLKVNPYVNVGFTDIKDKEKGKDYENILGEKSSYKPTRLFSTGMSVGVSFDL
jgi:hypothetical protein